MILKFFVSSVYAICQIAVGLVLHPYQTLQSVVQEKVFLWMSVFPGVLLFFLIVNWRMWMLAFLEFWFDCSPHFPLLCQLADVMALWIAFFCVYWQILVGYLTIRFILVFQKVR